MSVRTLRFFDMFVDVIYVSVNLECIDRVRENQHNANIYKRHPKVAREEPPGNKAEQHYDPREDKIFDDIAYDDREIKELIEKVIYDSNNQCESEQQQYETDLCGDARPYYRTRKHSEYHQRRKYACILKYLSHGIFLEPPLNIAQIFTRDYEPLTVIEHCLEMAVLELADLRKMSRVHDACPRYPDKV